MKKPIVVDGVTKSFGATRAVSDIHFSVATGELFGLIGPDGAGKSTLFRMLTSLLIPDQGRIEVLGLHTVKEYAAIRPRIGYMPGRFSLYPDLSVAENLHFFATIFGTSIQESYHLIKDIYQQLEPFSKRRAGQLSGGMKQKLALCCALVHQPEVLFLDEPTTGVDAVSRAEFWEMLQRLQAQGITILVSTPYMDEASLCERIALMQGGKMLSIDTPQNVRDSYQFPLYAIRASDFYHLLLDLRQQAFCKRVEPFGEYLHLTTQPDISLAELESFLTAAEYQQLEIKPIKANIEDVFLSLM